MITKRIPKSSEHPDSFNRLARYIAAAEEPGEKLHDFWIGNTGAAEHLEDLETALLDIEAVRKMKPGVNDKTYHFIVSFRPGEEEQLSGDDLRTIAGRFVDELGFKGHQYVAGAHENTDNFHMHVAVNRVHPETFRVHNPYLDYRTRDRVARELEKEYGLEVDRGKEAGKVRDGLSAKAQDFERHTWQQSFQGYLEEHRDTILGAVGKAPSWQGVHDVFARYHVAIRPRGAGLALVNLETTGRKPEAMKASALDRSLSRKALEDRLGPYRPVREHRTEREPDRRYEARPLLHRHPAIPGLWRRYAGFRRSGSNRPGIVARAAANWKMFLLTEAYDDPLAFVVLMAHKEMLRTVFGGEQQLERLPKDVAPAWRALRDGTAMEAVGRRHTAVNRTASANPLYDEAGNTLTPVRDKHGNLVGLLVVGEDGKARALGQVPQIPAQRRCFDNGPAMG